MRSLSALALTLVVVTPGFAHAQGGPAAGTVEITGATGLTINNQTVTVPGGGGDFDVTNASGAAGLHFYISDRLSLGVVGGFGRLSAGVEGSKITATGMLGGPQVRYRLGGERTALVLVGGAGGNILKLETTGSGVDEFSGEAVDANGWYWEAGADASFLFRDNLAFNIGARYSATRSTNQDGLQFDTAGLSIGVGFSFFINR